MELSNYPPGVTGREPQLSGIYPIEDTVDAAVEFVENARTAIEEATGTLDDQGLLDKWDDEIADKILKAIQELEDNINGKIPEEPGL